MKRSVMTAGLLATTLALTSAPVARADVRVAVGVRLGGGYHAAPDTFRYGYDRGTDEGYREGERDARRREYFDYRDEGRYRDSDRGYKRWMGPRFEYERGYRRGFEEGYARAYRRYARHRYGPYDPHDRRGRW